jgi:PilZ domain
MQKTSESDQRKVPTDSNRRRGRRVGLAFQIEVSGRDLAGTIFHDRAVTIDVSEDGCQFAIQRKLCPGQHLNLGLINTDFARHTGNKTQSFEVTWVETSHLGWTIGVRKLQGKNIWPMTFPIERKSPS